MTKVVQACESKFLSHRAMASLIAISECEASRLVYEGAGGVEVVRHWIKRYREWMRKLRRTAPARWHEIDRITGEDPNQQEPA